MKETIKNTADNDNSKKNADKAENLYAEDALALAGLSFKEKIAYKKELYQKRLASMSTKEKIFYTLQYYKWYFIGMVALLLCLAWTGKAIYRSTFPTVVNIAILNDATISNSYDYIPDTFRSYYHLDNKNFIKIYSGLYVSSTEDTTRMETNMTDYQKIGFYNSSDMLDAIIGDKEALILYASSDDTTAIDLSMDSDLYNKIKDHVITLSDPKGIKNDGKPYAAAIDISNTDFARGCNLTYDNVYLMIPSTKYTDNQRTINLIKLIFGL